jgi:hypothetical protein
MNSQKDYDRFFRQRFPDVRHAMAAVYLWGLPLMEAGRLGKLIIASTDQWQKTVFMDRHTVAKALEDLHKLDLVEYTPGKVGLNKIGAKVRRRTMEEIMTLCPRVILDKFVPSDLAKLAEVLTERGLPWGNEIVFPQWSVQCTGRIGPSKGPPAGKSKSERQEAFLASLKPGEILTEHDLKSAEPTILMHELARLGYWKAPEGMTDIYQVMADAERIDRSKAKRLFMRTSYTRAQRIIPKAYWPAELRSLFEAINLYRDYLWELWPATNEHHRQIYTLSGRMIQHDGRKRMHRGRVLSWRLQGTVADIIMPAVRKLIQAERKDELRFYCQFHDSVIYATRRDVNQMQFQRHLETEIEALGIQMDIETKQLPNPTSHV